MQNGSPPVSKDPRKAAEASEARRQLLLQYMHSRIGILGHSRVEIPGNSIYRWSDMMVAREQDDLGLSHGTAEGVETDGVETRGSCLRYYACRVRQNV